MAERSRLKEALDEAVERARVRIDTAYRLIDGQIVPVALGRHLQDTLRDLDDIERTARSVADLEAMYVESLNGGGE